MSEEKTSFIFETRKKKEGSASCSPKKIEPAYVKIENNPRNLISKAVDFCAKIDDNKFVYSHSLKSYNNEINKIEELLDNENLKFYVDEDLYFGYKKKQIGADSIFLICQKIDDFFAVPLKMASKSDFDELPGQPEN